MGFLLGLAVCLAPQSAVAQPTNAKVSPTVDERLTRLEERIDTVQIGRNRYAAGGTLAMLFGAFCALWAQNTKRNPWLWFFLGAFFSVITVLVLLAKNSNDRRAGG